MRCIFSTESSINNLSFPLQSKSNTPNPAIILGNRVKNDPDSQQNAPAIPVNSAIGLAGLEKKVPDGSDDDEIVKVLGARPTDNGIEFEVTKNKGASQIVNSKIANHEWPQAVIRFYEARLVFND